AEAAERAGFDTVMVMDHFYQLPMLGQPDSYMLECYSLLSALSQRTSRVRLGALVTGNTYRNPALLAKTVTTLDIVSGGPGPARHRGRVVRARAPLARLPVRHVRRAVRQARGGAADHRADAARRATHRRGAPLPGDRGDQPAGADRAGPGRDRRRGGAPHVAARRPVRRRVEPAVLAARDPPQARRPRRPLRGRGPRPQRDHRQRPALGPHRPDPRGGDGDRPPLLR